MSNGVSVLSEDEDRVSLQLGPERRSDYARVPRQRLAFSVLNLSPAYRTDGVYVRDDDPMPELSSLIPCLEGEARIEEHFVCVMEVTRQRASTVTVQLLPRDEKQRQHDLKAKAEGRPLRHLATLYFASEERGFANPHWRLQVEMAPGMHATILDALLSDKLEALSLDVLFSDLYMTTWADGAPMPEFSPTMYLRPRRWNNGESFESVDGDLFSVSLSLGRVDIPSAVASAPPAEVSDGASFSEDQLKAILGSLDAFVELVADTGKVIAWIGIAALGLLLALLVVLVVALWG